MKNKDEMIGGRMSRVDAVLKVTGQATYFAEYEVPNLTYGVLVPSTITKGRIKNLDTKKAESAPGVLAVITHLNAPKVPAYEAQEPSKTSSGRGPGMMAFHTDEIHFNGQPIAMVVADTFERATFAASLVKADYQEEKHQTELKANLAQGKVPKTNKSLQDYQRGEKDAYKNAPVKLEEEYVLPTEVHNPMELHGILAHWEAADKITVYAKTQGVKMTQQVIADTFKLPKENVQVHSQFVGGAFGMSLRVWPHEIATILAAKKVNRPVKLVITRNEMFTIAGYRPHTHQKVGIGATKDGKIVGISHWAHVQNSNYEEFTEATVAMTKFMYRIPNVNTTYRIVPLDICSPVPMRGPGEATGAFALESAMDELSYALNVDPIELRLMNYPEKDPERDLPWSSNHVRDAYKMGADKIGWANRSNKPKSKMEDGMWVGYGMATGTFGAHRRPATARACLNADGTLLIQSAASDIGPGTGTAVVQIAAEVMGIPASKIRFELGESKLPDAPIQGGSATVASVGSAVHDACLELRQKLVELSGNALKNAKAETLVYEDGKISSPKDRSASITYTEVLKRNSLPKLEVTKESKLDEDQQKKFAMYSFSVHFVKVHVHPTTGVVKVKHAVALADAGTIVNHKTASSQMMGGAVGGIGMALTEEAIIDHRFGRYVNNNFADYHVPVNADIPDVDVLFVDKKDPYTNPMGSKGLGEIAIIGMAPAIANAVYNATGKRVRELPITPDKLI